MERGLLKLIKMKGTVLYLFLILLVLGCSTVNTKHSSNELDEKQICMVKDLIDEIFQKKVVTKRYLTLNNSDTIFIETDSILGINKNWNNVVGDNKYEVFTVDTTNRHSFKFLNLRVFRRSIELEVISESTGNLIVGEAKLKDGIWYLGKIRSGIR